MRDLQYEGSWWGFSNYDELIASMELRILVQEHDDDYQGDSYYIFKKGREYGVLIFGWGSCSGCDALQACDSVAEVTNLRDDLYDRIQWLSKSGLREWLANRNEANDWWLNYSQGRTFLARARELVN